MKSKMFLAVTLVFLAACSSQPKFEFDITLKNNKYLINKEIVINEFKITKAPDKGMVYSDTFKIKGEHLSLKLPYDGPAIISVSIPKSENNFITLLAAEEGKVTLEIDGNSNQIGGTPLNERWQEFRNASDSVSNLFKRLEQDGYLAEDSTITRSDLLRMNTDRILQFVKDNIDNQIGEYLFINDYNMMPMERRLEMNLFVSDRIKEIMNLKLD